MIRADVERLLASLNLALSEATPVAGGDINQAWRLRCDERLLFLKFHARPPADMFEAEAAGLRELADSAALRVPVVLTHDRHHLVLEHLSLSGRNSDSDAQLGTGLALLHRNTRRRFGWSRDNYIGTTPQRNDECDDWVEFYLTRRLQPQVEGLVAAGGPSEARTLLERLCRRLSDYFSDYRPQPSLLHGDLWGGNASALGDGTPVIYDPACYYGDRETDLAMMELFGGFGAACFEAYEREFPIDPGYPRRRPLYQLYHILNHANLFGGGYVQRSLTMMRELAG